MFNVLGELPRDAFDSVCLAAEVYLSQTCIYYLLLSVAVPRRKGPYNVLEPRRSPGTENNDGKWKTTAAVNVV